MVPKLRRASREAAATPGRELRHGIATEEVHAMATEQIIFLQLIVEHGHRIETVFKCGYHGPV